MVVRVWTENNDDRGLRARITQTLDVTGRERSLAVAASAEDICEAVKSWVEAFRQQPSATAPEDRAEPENEA